MYRLMWLTRVLCCGFLTCLPALAAEKYGQGVTDNQILIGQTAPYSGPASAYGSCGRANDAYFRMVNDQGGVNGRKLKLISLDDGYDPAKAIEHTRRLVEQDGVLLVFGTVGAPALSVLPYLHAMKVPFLFPTSAHAKFHMPNRYPYTMGWVPTFGFEGKMFARYILKHRRDAKIAVLWEYDDIGIEELAAFKEELGAKAKSMIVSEQSYQVTDPSINSQLIAMRNSGADTLVSLTTPKFEMMTIQRVYEMNWRPLHLITYASHSVGTTLKPVGLEKAKGLVTAYFGLDATNPELASHPEVMEFHEWRRKYLPDADPGDACLPYSYMQSALLVQVLKQCGDDLTRENLMRQARSMRNVRLPMLLPGISIDTSESDYRPIETMHYLKFDGKSWVPTGESMREGGP
ncbi:MAG: ABC transporter substrate-binding protein [Betaproteobacteria bacterium]|nr:ABC transporter substrate-binding protein [Betaproteobacteria bacterium]